ncbi:hypothetical protein KCTC32516_00242 [Polaribacter huanghezhanensis]|uniref:hypothetical protein n=1 Tax=Polaribacter huanghezhanensis TaxID=1354726 RepID=UPI002647FBFE|nr:hypothetical protein [Polaribacter huanghezhanensis]WKD84906.1 hypothetical protein KCTC32516_00242 [Polaribacter huanghezhanensis]
MKKIFFLGFFITSFSFFGQQKLNNYKYVVVANKFDFFKKADQYETSSLTKFLFNKYGYTAFLSTETFPEDLKVNKCSSLFASINDASSMFTIKVNLVLKDCIGKIIYTSSLGKTKEKDFKKGFHKAIRNAFKDPIIRNYSYKPEVVITNNVVKVIETPKVEKAAIVKTVVANTTSADKVTNSKNTIENVLYAQAIINGFQLVDTVPKVIFKVLKTQQETVFIIENKNGILYKKNSIWIAEFYENGKRIQKEYQIKF